MVIEAAEPWLSPETQRVSSPFRPEDNANCLSWYTFSWIFRTIGRAADKGRLDEADLPQLPSTDEPSVVFRKFASLWRRQVLRSRRPGLLRILVCKAQLRLCSAAFFHNIVALFCMTLDPLMLHALLSEAETGAKLGSGLVLVGAMTLSLLGRVACQEISWFTSVRVMNNARTAIVHAVFRRALAANDAQHDVGQLTNLMATDADKIGKNQGLPFFAAQWAWGVVCLPITMIFLFHLVGGASALLTAVVIVLGSLVNKYLARATAPMNRKVQEKRDRRSQLMTELVQGVRTVKLQVWEQIWFKRISAVRDEEMRLNVFVMYLSALNGLVGNLLALAVPTSIFAWYVIVDGRSLDSTTAFTTLAWISVLQWSLQTLPNAYNTFANLMPSLRRLGDFLALEDGETADVLTELAGGSAIEVPYDEPSDVSAMISMHGTLGFAGCQNKKSEPNGDARQNKADTVVLTNVDLDIFRGELVLVAGPIGCGKSTLLAALAGARTPISGLCSLHGSRAYAAQRPFLLNATVRDNILFTKAFDPQVYADVLARCALGPDLEALAHGDETHVGDNGVQLSGGQKARVALARVLYARAQIVICDDILSAVDAHTAKHIWEEAIIGGLVARGSTVVLATHQVQYLSHNKVTRVVILKDGGICIQCPWRDVPTNQKDDLLSFVGSWDEQGSSELGPRRLETCRFDQEKKDTKSRQLTLVEVQEAVEGLLVPLQGRQMSPVLIHDVISKLSGRNEEEPARGTITWADFRVYLSAFGSNFLVVMLIASALGTGLLSIMGNVWLAYWTSHPDTQNQKQCLMVYVAIGVLNGLFSTAQSFILACCAIRASRRIHESMLTRLLAAPLSFFDRVANGSILNRFLQDLDNIDNFVPNSLMTQLTRTLNIITQLSLIWVEAPWVLLSLPVLIPPYIAVFRHIRIPNRDTRRVEATAHSPVYGHFGDTLSGRETIRSFNVEPSFAEHNMKLIGRMARATYGNQAVAKWAQAVSTQWSCVLYLVSGICCITLSSQGKMTGGQVGLVLLYAANLNRAIMDYLMGTTTLETQFVSVERVAEYTRLPQEFQGNVESEHIQTHENWPSQGSISISGVCLRYALHMPLALQGIDLEINSGLKVALCGRTGCGKSSLFGVLTRLYPAHAGRVLVDGRNLLDVPLNELRRAIGVVAQDAFLVSGTVLENLLPRDRDIELGRKQCEHVLQMVRMSQRISEAGGLDAEVEVGGRNFSAGERQLLTLARALMSQSSLDTTQWRPPPILLCDEATASVDLVADGLVHDVLLGLNSTVVMICHRLQYIGRFDLAAVLDAGLVVESGPPQNLLATKPSTRLALLCEEAGITTAIQENV